MFRAPTQYGGWLRHFAACAAKCQEELALRDGVPKCPSYFSPFALRNVLAICAAGFWST
jgi:hypothetical protein